MQMEFERQVAAVKAAKTSRVMKGLHISEKLLPCGVRIHRA